MLTPDKLEMVFRWWSRLAAIPTIVAGFADPLFILWRLAVARRRPGIGRLRTGPSFEVRGALDLWIIKEVCLDGEYVHFSSPLPTTAVVVDVGAGLGEFAVDLGYRNPGHRIIAVEPAPDSFALLLRNLERNGLTNVVAVEAAIAAEAGALGIDLDIEPAMRRTEAWAATTGRTSVDAMTLEELFARHGIERCDLLKVDCEGAEEAILGKASPELLARVARIVVETHREGAAIELAGRLHDLGFTANVVQSRAWRHLALIHAERPDRK